MRYSQELIKFCLSETYEARLPMVNGTKMSVDWQSVADRVCKHFHYNKKKFSANEAEWIFDNFTITAYIGLQRKEQPQKWIAGRD